MSDAWLRAGSKQWLFLEQTRGPSTTVSSRPASWLRARSLTRHRPDPRGARQVEGRRCSSREEDRSTVDSVSFRSRAADRKRPAAWTTARARVRPPSSPWASRSGRAHALALARAMVLRDRASTKKRVSKFVRKFQNWRTGSSGRSWSPAAAWARAAQALSTLLLLGAPCSFVCAWLIRGLRQLKPPGHYSEAAAHECRGGALVPRVRGGSL